MLRALEGLDLGAGVGASCVAVPPQLVVAGDARAVGAAVRASGLVYPLLAKPLLADGSALSHALALVYDEAGLARLAGGEVAGLRPPCVLQQFVDHGGCIFKVYCVGDAVSLTRRRSLPDQAPPLPPGLATLERISTLGALARQPEGPPPLAPAAAAVPEPPEGFVRALAAALQTRLGLQLFNFDLIRPAGHPDTFLVVDINYFPGIAKMPGYEAVFADFLCAAAEKSRESARLREGGQSLSPQPVLVGGTIE